MSTEADLPPAPSRLRARIFGLSWLSYFTYYFTRQNYSVAKTSLGLADAQLKNIETGYLAAYAVGQFANGALCDVIGPRRLLAAGMLASAVLSLWFATGSVFTVFLIAYGLNGLAQSSGWPGNGKVMASWFSTQERGTVMGWWSTCYQLGGVAAMFFATYLLGQFGWRGAFVGPAIAVAAVGVAVLIWLRDRPSQLGYRDPDVARAVEPSREERRRLRRAAWPLVLRSPMIWSLGANYFCMKLMRYTLLMWLPYYNEKVLHYGKTDSAYMATAFGVGGAIGVVVSGLLADHVLGKRRALVAALGTLCLAGAFFLYGRVAAQGPTESYVAMMLVGALLFGPDSLVSGALAQDVGGPHAAALACGVVNGIGSIGAVLQGEITVRLKTSYGFDAIFALFVVLSLVATVALLPFVGRRPAVSAAVG